MSTLIVFLPLEPVTALTEVEYLLTQDGRTAGSHTSAPAALLPQPTGAAAEVVAVVPASALSWHQVELPRGTSPRSPRLRAVLEGLLEDRLLDEPDALHFALQPQPRAGAPVWVAVCNRDWLRNAMLVLEEAQRPAMRIVPEFAPDDAPALYAQGDPDNALLVVISSAGVTILPLGSPALALLPVLPEEAPLMAEPAVAALAEQLLQRKVELQQAQQRWLQAGQSAWDLAQFDLASSSRARTFKKVAALWAELVNAPQWRPVRWAAVLLLALNLIGLNAWAWKERSALAAKRDAVTGVLATTFPQVKVIVDPPIQMEKEVALLRQAAGATSGRDLEAMLGALGAAAPQQPVSGLEFSASQLRVKGLAYSADQARAVAISLKSRGYAANVQGDTLVLTQEPAP